MKKVPLIYVENTIEIENMYHSSLIEGNVCYTSIQQVKFACNDLSFNNSSDFMPKISIKPSSELYFLFFLHYLVPL